MWRECYKLGSFRFTVTKLIFSQNIITLFCSYKLFCYHKLKDYSSSEWIKPKFLLWEQIINMWDTVGRVSG